MNVCLKPFDSYFFTHSGSLSTFPLFHVFLLKEILEVKLITYKEVV